MNYLEARRGWWFKCQASGTCTWRAVENFEHDESPRLVIYDLDIGGLGHGDNIELDEEYHNKRPK